jgi:hypothetical protein
VDKAPFPKTLDLTDEGDIYVLLVDGEGRVLWRAEGSFTPGKGVSLKEAIGAGRHDEVS